MKYDVFIEKLKPRKAISKEMIAFENSLLQLPRGAGALCQRSHPEKHQVGLEAESEEEMWSLYCGLHGEEQMRQV